MAGLIPALPAAPPGPPGGFAAADFAPPAAPPPGAPPRCLARNRRCIVTGHPVLAAPHCAVAGALACLRQPSNPPHPGWTVCAVCWSAINAFYRPAETNVLTILYVERGVAGQPKYVQQAPPPMIGVLSFMCRHCEADELEHYKRQIAQGAAAPPGSRNGCEDTCTCQATFLELTNPPAPIAGAPTPRYCQRCREMAMNELLHRALLNAKEFELSARNAAGAIVTANAAFTTKRRNEGKPLSCRCGRDALEAYHNPKVTHCMCCGGVQIDAQQVKWQRNTAATIRARAAAGTLAPLQLVSANFNPNIHPRNPAVFVGQNDNRR